MKKDSGDKITQTRTEIIGNPNITTKPSKVANSNPTSKSIDVSPTTRRVTPKTSPRIKVDENTTIAKSLI